METSEAAALIQRGVAEKGGVWADLGAGSGTFTRALADLLGPAGRIYAIDRDPAALRALARWTEAQRAESASAEARVIPVAGDFLRLDSLPAVADVVLDGVLLANALHFAPDPARLLAEVARMLRRGGRLLVVEYDRRPPSPWVPYPVPEARLRELALTVGFTEPQIVGSRPSRYSGRLYAAVSLRGKDV